MSRNPVWKGRAEDRGRLLTIRSNKKIHRTVKVANPDFGGAGIEVKGAFFVDLRWGIRRRKDFDADFGCMSEKNRFLVYLGEISYSVYMVCIPWEVLFVNVAANVGHFTGKQLPPLLWLVFLITLVPLAAVTHHFIEKPARERMKLWRRSRTPHNFATVTAR